MWRRVTGVAVAVVTVAGLIGGAGTADAAGLTDPAQNVAASPSYWPPCSQSGTDSQACTNAVIAAINHARSLEGVAPMVLPADFATLSPAQQTFVASNLERVDRGLAPVVGMVDSLNTLAQDAAVAQSDPVLPTWSVGPFRANAWSSIWAGDLNPLAADYDWMYADGWSPSGSYNLDCTSATADGCWGHRHAILSAGDNLITGVGSDDQSRWLSIAQIFVGGTGGYPSFTYSWADVTGSAAAPTESPVVQPLAQVVPAVSLWTLRTGSGRFTVSASITPAVGQQVRLRRHTVTGWQTVRRAAAMSAVTFTNVRSGTYRLIVDPVDGVLRAALAFTAR
jgi:hypothetical protein